ncbi:hypothetical protein K439DRAFT_1400475 [Ramaria rubella]|nr:hypothetical protein K439DRAFT_1013667 [Ramaria rubella]KAF8592563.1 hypothetical protein K439DRAFT_1400475 [Ramaria rubella]
MSCESLLSALKECLLRSDCVRKDKMLPSVCLREHTDDLPLQCKSLRKAVFDCKRSQLDMRKRFRGKPVVGNVQITMESEKG